MPRKKPTWMPDPNWSEEDWKAVNWCIANNIIISPIRRKEKYTVGIALYDYRNINYDKFMYDKDQVWDKVLEYSMYYYGKYRKQDSAEASAEG